MRVTYLGHYGDDLVVVNAARVSFGKRKDAFDEKDARLIGYLVRHGHVLPFRHPHVSFHFKAPIFVARQLVKHQVGMSWSEISRRYVTSEPEFYWPETWRKAAVDKKQGSSDEEFSIALNTGICVKSGVTTLQTVLRDTVETYDALIKAGMAPEQARMILPQNTYTEWVWTGSLLSWAHLWKLRVEHSAQQETQDCVRMIGPDMERLFPVSWKE